MKYVDINEETGEVSWDRYFEYLNSAQSDFPPKLYAYAANWEHYSLDGANTLHDAWLLGAHFAYGKKELLLEFVAARQDRKFSFKYLAIDQYKWNLDVGYRFGDRDILAHEFYVEAGLVVHELVFSNRGRILVRSENVVPSTETLS